MGKTIAEKIIAGASGRREVVPGEVLFVEPDAITCSPSAINVLSKLKALGLEGIPRPERIMASEDHNVPILNKASAERAKAAREAAKLLGVTNYYDIGRHGIEHEMGVQLGYVLPGMMVINGDTRAATNGAVGAFSVPVIFELYIAIILGKMWLEVPKSIKVTLYGKPPFGVTPRDIGLWVINDIGAERGDYNVLEFYGPAVHDMTVDWRMVLCNLSSDIGAKSAICDVDQVTLDYVTPRARRPFEVVRSDPDANYAYTFEYDVSKMVPAISVPPSPDYVEPLTQHLGKHVDQAYIGSCVGGTIEDLRLAAKVLKGHKIHPRVRLVVSPNTMPNYQQASAEGLLQILAESGAHIMEPSCFPCYGMMFQLADGEVCISSSVRNDPGRMGNINSTIYLANAATTAASAVKGEIADPREFLA